jgi:superfamily II DNA/RNA helicase
MEVESESVSDFPFQSLDVDVEEDTNQLAIKGTILHQSKHKQTIGQEKLKIEDFPLLSDKLKYNLEQMKITELFPVQAHVIPYVLNNENPFSRDICVSAPTGSGKTLTYLLPIMQVLEHTVIDIK